MCKAERLWYSKARGEKQLLGKALPNLAPDGVPAEKLSVVINVFGGAEINMTRYFCTIWCSLFGSPPMICSFIHVTMAL
jgi:hypothetical protein